MSETSFGQRFLRDLSLLRGQADPWGPGAVELIAPGGPYRVSGLTPSQLAEVERHFRERAIAPRDGDASDLPRFECGRAPAEAFVPHGERELRLDVAWRGEELLIAGRDILVRASRADPPCGRFWTPDGDGGEIFYGGFLTALRPVAALRLFQRNCLLLHSSAVATRRGALVFFGHSESGKSTVAKLALARGLEVLSDDLNVLSSEGEGLAVEAFPEAGELRERSVPQGRYPVRGLYRLVQGSSHSVEPLGSAEAVATVAASAPLINRSADLQPDLMDLLAAMVDRVRVGRLVFAPDAGLWDLFEND